ncbi:MAG: hypothetical protein ACRC1L_03870, partial [Prochlorococcaceae cyanobacterium]
MSGTLGLGGSIFDLLDSPAEDPISQIKELGEQLFSSGSFDYGSFEFIDSTIISGEITPEGASFDVSRLISFSANIVFGSPHSIGLGKDLWDELEESGLVTFGGDSGSGTYININLIDGGAMESISDSFDFGAYFEPEDPSIDDDDYLD